MLKRVPWTVVLLSLACSGIAPEKQIGPVGLAAVLLAGAVLAGPTMPRWWWPVVSRIHRWCSRIVVIDQ